MALYTHFLKSCVYNHSILVHVGIFSKNPQVSCYFKLNDSISASLSVKILTINFGKCQIFGGRGK